MENESKSNNDLMNKIPDYFTFLGLLISLMSIVSLIFAFNILFHS